MSSKLEDNSDISLDPKAVENRLHMFMKEGGCEEPYKAWIGSDGVDGRRETYPMLKKCMKARSDYFQPFFALRRNREALIVREMKVFLEAKAEDGEELFYKYMTEGSCKEAFMAWIFSKESETKIKRNRMPTSAMETMLNCMQADRSDYYHPFLNVLKTAKEKMIEEMMALGTGEQADANKEG
ncbi:hypothetical protein CARUB_v10010405mg [Capsella rubella]|uniref:GCK domain-containing protein n=1 Tax=Capsella rubella TaxID=81985 RepID=R0IFP1_9BRAS|nr:uncharacterized protein LOC17898712 [Capsella rubella]EOA37130.1 hypothetical protein CARUB_v10010405mg [Capsella rubella]